METLAAYFDTPLDSKEHAILSDEAWMGGPMVAIPYYLGRILGRNLFREEQSEVERCFREWLTQRTSARGAAIAAQDLFGPIPSAILRYEFETSIGRTPAGKPREIAAVLAYLTDPDVSRSELTEIVHTTEKQLERMSLLRYARILMQRSGK